MESLPHQEIWIFEPIQQGCLVFRDHVLLWISWTENEKFVDNTQQYFVFTTHQTKIYETWTLKILDRHTHLTTSDVENYLGTRRITRLNIMTYIDSASNPGSKQQRLGATNCENFTLDKLQTFRTIFGISRKFVTKNYLHDITLSVLFWRVISCKRNHRIFQKSKEKEESMIWEKISCINGCMIIVNLVSL